MGHRHPSEDILKAYAIGDIDEKVASLVSAHTQHCSLCAQIVRTEEDLHAQELVQVEPFKRPNFDHLYHKILTPPALSIEKVEEKEPHHFPSQFEIEGLNIDIPRSLRPLLARASSWKSVLGNISYAKVEMDGPGHFYFVYFKKGAKISQHSHKGHEFSYVVAGSFNDEFNEYVTGDFAWFDKSDTHTPQTQDPDGCLLAVVIDAPFIFKKGLSRLLNPLGMWPY